MKLIEIKKEKGLYQDDGGEIQNLTCCWTIYYQLY